MVWVEIVVVMEQDFHLKGQTKTFPRAVASAVISSPTHLFLSFNFSSPHEEKTKTELAKTPSGGERGEKRKLSEQAVRLTS